MKRIIRSSFGLVLALLLITGFSQKTYASHYQGSDLTYLAVAPNVYVVTLKYYRDCTGIDLGTSETLNIKSVGCNGGRNVTLNQSGGVITGNPYCGTQTVSPCSSSSPANYQARIFTNTITFTPAEMACQNWLLSTSNGSRPAIENLVDADLQNIYTEAYLRLSATAPNNSPEFAPSNVPIPFVCVNQDAVFSMNAAEADGDSLSYELVRPLSAANTPIPYAINTNPGGASIPNASQPQIDPSTGKCTVINNSVSPACLQFYRSGPFDNRPLPYQTAILPAGFCTGTPPTGGQGQPYTQFVPLPVGGLGVDWVTNCQTNVIATYGGFRLDSLTGTLFFRPTAYHPNTPAVDGRNKYAVAVQINEWRKINGTMTKVGYIRRDILVIVNDCQNQVTTGTVPKPAPIYGAVFSDTVLNVQACTTTRFVLKYSDKDATDLLDVKFAGETPSGGNFVYNGAPGVPAIPGLVRKPFVNKQNKVDVVFYMTPNTTDVGKDFFLRVTIEDNHCPIKGRTDLVYRIHINKSNRAAPVANNRDRTICLGETTPIDVVLSRPDSIKQAPAVYTYNWTDKDANGGLPNGLNAANQHDKNIVVTPTQTTRYFLTITSTLPGCSDTTSVIVRVDNPDRAKVTGDDTIDICKGTSANIIIAPDMLNGAPVVPYTSYQWAPAPGLNPAQATLTNITVTPTVTTRYFLTAFNAASKNCPDTTSVLVRVDTPDPLDITRTFKNEICEGEIVPITITLNTPNPAATYTYEWSLAPGVSADSAGFDSLAANMPTISVKPIKSTWYYITIKSSLQACADKDSVFIKVNTALNNLSVAAGLDAIPYRGETTLTVVNGSVTDTYEWSSEFAADMGTISGFGQSVKVNPLETTTYFVKITNALGCDTTLSKTIEVGTYFANIITPNNDGLNDFLNIPNIGEGTTVQIYNRWGKMIKEYKNYKNVKGQAFDGKDATDGTYYYFVKQADGTKTKGWFDILDSKK